jgi:chemotaxis protein MotA
MNIPIGWIVALAGSLYGYSLMGGHIGDLWVPEEYLVIFGAALGTLIASNKWRNLKNLFTAFTDIFRKSGHSRAANLQLLCLMFELLQKIRRDGALRLESDINQPKSSPLFQKYPKVLHNPRLIEFITDYFRLMMDGLVTLQQLDSVMSQETETINQEFMEPSHSMMTLADSMPAFGIVAAIVGVIHTLGSLKAGSSPSDTGAMIAAALTGTLVGVFSAYAIFSPISRVLQQMADAELKPYEAVREILIAHYSGFAPMTAVEYGRKVLYTDQRPSMMELQAGVQSVAEARAAA